MLRRVIKPILFLPLALSTISINVFSRETNNYIDNVFKTLSKIKNNSSILIIGPNGIGKNFLANTIHMNLSSNNPDTFINLNENLMNESDLLKLSSLHNYFTIYLNDYEKFNQIEILNYLNLVKNSFPRKGFSSLDNLSLIHISEPTRLR